MLAAFTAFLAPRHHVEVRDPERTGGSGSLAETDHPGAPADVYLLNSHPWALALAARREERGVPVRINAFPGIRGHAGAPQAPAESALRAAAGAAGARGVQGARPGECGS